MRILVVSWGDDMVKLTTKTRKRIPKSKFALPAERKYPIHDKAHAINAKARAKQQLKAGNLSKSKYNTVISKANAKLKTGVKKSKKK